MTYGTGDSPDISRYDVPDVNLGNAARMWNGEEHFIQCVLCKWFAHGKTCAELEQDFLQHECN